MNTSRQLKNSKNIKEALAEQRAKFKILGYGKVVKSFLYELPNAPMNVEVYGRSSEILPLDDGFLAHEDDVVVFCCSIDEKAYLDQKKIKPDRCAVFYPNLAIVNDFLQKGYFKKGKIFVLSNPCELLAEHIRNQSKNNHVYALGLSNDFLRYQRIFAKTKQLGLINAGTQLGGNHYQRSCILTNFNLENSFYEKMQEAFIQEVQSEFNGTSPPVYSGVVALTHLLTAFLSKKALLVSGFSSFLECFTGGSYDFKEQKFTPSHGISQTEQQIIVQIADHHKLIREQLFSS